MAADHVPLAAEAGAARHGEALGLEAAAHAAGGGEGGQGRARAAPVCQLLKQLRLPHGRVAGGGKAVEKPDRKSTRLNSSHVAISYAVFCLKKKKRRQTLQITEG